MTELSQNLAEQEERLEAMKIDFPDAEKLSQAIQEKEQVRQQHSAQ